MELQRQFGRGLRRPVAAVYLGVSPSKFDAMRKDGVLPAPRLMAGAMVWDRVELDEFFDALPTEANDNDANPWDEQ